MFPHIRGQIWIVLKRARKGKFGLRIHDRYSIALVAALQLSYHAICKLVNYMLILDSEKGKSNMNNIFLTMPMRAH